MSASPIAIVVPWYGESLGGAERQARQVALGLAGRGRAVEVLTTCCRSSLDDWGSNYFPAGASLDGPVTVRRFAVDPRDQLAFDQVNEHLMRLPPSALRAGVCPVSLPEARAFVENSINSSALLDYLRAGGEGYGAFIFIPYLYGPTLRGLPLVAHKAFLQPCLHDESYAYLPQVAALFREAQGILFNSEGEATLACGLYGPGIFSRSIVVGEGIELHSDRVEGTGRALPSQLERERFVLYLGRRDATKNTGLLVGAYKRFRQAHPHSSLRLVLAGPGRSAYGARSEGLIDLGVVTEGEKAALLESCLALFQPSRNESYSRVMMEAWSYGRPVAASRDCLATAIAVERSRGGWVASTEAEWADAFATVDSSAGEQLAAAGERGRAYAREHADWSQAIGRYEEVLDRAGGRRKVARARPAALKTLHQFLPDLAYGDAISNQAIHIRDYLRSAGYESEIYVKHLDRRMADFAKVFDASLVADEAGLLYHHSIGSELTARAIRHRGPKCLIYHNVTPAEFFRPYRPGFAWMLERGRADLQLLARHFTLSAADSLYNAEELARCGFDSPRVLPIIVDPEKWNISPDPSLMEQLQDGKANLLFVGRIAPNKRQDQLLEAFSCYRSVDPDARLLIIGEGQAFDPYYQHLKRTIERLDLSSHVMLTGQVDDAQLLAFYQTAHLYWSMSEHEGFCVPIVEAMWFDIPVLAYHSSAVPETLGGAGVLFTDKEDLARVAARAGLLVRDPSTRKSVLAAQARRRKDFLPAAVWPILESLLGRMKLDRS